MHTSGCSAQVGFWDDIVSSSHLIARGPKGVKRNMLPCGSHMHRRGPSSDAFALMSFYHLSKDISLTFGVGSDIPLLFPALLAKSLMARAMSAFSPILEISLCSGMLW